MGFAISAVSLRALAIKVIGLFLRREDLGGIDCYRLLRTSSFRTNSRNYTTVLVFQLAVKGTRRIMPHFRPLMLNSRGPLLPSVVLGFAARPIEIHFTQTLLEPTRTRRAEQVLPASPEVCFEADSAPLPTVAICACQRTKSVCPYSAHSAPRGLGSLLQDDMSRT